MHLFNKDHAVYVDWLSDGGQRISTILRGLCSLGRIFIMTIVNKSGDLLGLYRIPLKTTNSNAKNTRKRSNLAYFEGENNKFMDRYLNSIDSPYNA